MTNKLFYGDNLDVLRNHIADESVDLIYLDPPFNSDANYNVLFKAPAGKRSEAQIEAFKDTWTWGEAAARALDDVIRSRHTEVAVVLRAMRSILHESDVMAYLCIVAVRLIELRRVLKPTGSFYLHCDPTASHYLRTLLDTIFGAENFRSEIVWKRTGSHGGSNRWGPLHDTILFYTKAGTYTWNRTFQEYDPSYIRGAYSLKDNRGMYQLVSLTGAGTRTGDSGKPWRGIDPTEVGRHCAAPLRALAVAYPDRDVSNLTSQEKLDLLDAAGLVA